MTDVLFHYSADNTQAINVTLKERTTEPKMPVTFTGGGLNNMNICTFSCNRIQLPRYECHFWEDFKPFILSFGDDEVYKLIKCFYYFVLTTLFIYYAKEVTV